MASNGAGVCVKTPTKEQIPRKAMPEAGGNGIGTAKNKPLVMSLGDGAMLTAEQASPAETPFACLVRGGGIYRPCNISSSWHRGAVRAFLLSLSKFPSLILHFLPWAGRAPAVPRLGCVLPGA